MRIWVKMEDVDRFLQAMTLDGYTAEVIATAAWRAHVSTNAPRRVVDTLARRVGVLVTTG